MTRGKVYEVTWWGMSGEGMKMVPDGEEDY
jgi:hypothetical protein